AAEARRLGKPIVFIQANIHAGEVEGKEAILAVLRRHSQAGPSGLLGKIVLLVAPIYNADGNEKFAPVEQNRPSQNGPNTVGVRANGQGLDLNRDAIKAEAPETRGLLKYVYSTWDPDVMMDLHTTNGTRHGYDLTYSPPLNPNTDPEIMRLSRDVIIPAVRRSFDRPLFDYGNTEKRGDVTAWYTFGQEGRYCTNYVGLRNRIGILSEAFTSIPFKDRVEVTDRFVMSVLGWVAGHSKQVIDATRAADARSLVGKELGVRFDFASRGKEAVLLEKGPRGKGRVTSLEKVRMEVFDRFKATKTERAPVAYLLPASAEKAVQLLTAHGIVVERLLGDWRGSGEELVVSEFKQAERPFQGHKLIELNGALRPARITALAGSTIVRVDQPLGGLAFHLLEGESLDGLAAWGFLGDVFPVGSVFPVTRLSEVARVATVRVNRD
ncbi:MAG TPA: M14 family metallopeptidase, partial [Fimbriimonas sp.]|nr:M14 family metallopeptidase [Fimbriimonas sp.]